MTIRSALEAYVREPDEATRAALHREIKAVATFTPDTPWLDRARSLADQDRHDEVIRLVEGRMPGALLCPMAHGLLHVAYEATGRAEEAQAEEGFALMSLHAILTSGEGTKAEPWRVLRVADEYAALESLGLTPTRQRYVVGDGRRLDLISCTDGVDRWFELV